MIEPHRKGKGAAKERRMLGRDIKPKMDPAARSLGRQEAHAIIAEIAATAPRVAAMTRQAFPAAWSYGIDRGAVSENPFLGRNLGGAIKAKKRERVLSQAEARALFVRCANLAHIRPQSPRPWS